MSRDEKKLILELCETHELYSLKSRIENKLYYGDRKRLHIFKEEKIALLSYINGISIGTKRYDAVKKQSVGKYGAQMLGGLVMTAMER